MATESTETPVNAGVMVQIQVQLGVLQGTVNTLLTALGNRVTNNEEETKQLRVDLTAVKDNGIAADESLRNSITQNTSAIAELRSDVAKVEQKQDNSWVKTGAILSPFVAVAALVWNVLGGK